MDITQHTQLNAVYIIYTHIILGENIPGENV